MSWPHHIAFRSVNERKSRFVYVISQDLQLTCLWSFARQGFIYDNFLQILFLSLWGEVYYHWGWGIIEVYYHWISSIYDPQDVPPEAVSNKLFQISISWSITPTIHANKAILKLLSLAWMNDEGNWKQRVLKIRSGALNCSQRKDQSSMRPFENSRIDTELRP